MEKLQIGQTFETNKVIFKLIQQQTKFPISIGLKLYKIAKIFDEIEEYVFNIMDMTFENFNIMEMTDEQKILFDKIMSEEIEVEIDKVPLSCFENNEKVMLTIDEIDKLSIILKENTQ